MLHRPEKIGPLAGQTVIDLTRLLPGPLGTLFLSDLGAEVIKIEDPSEPDFIRNFTPFIGKQSVFYYTLNRDKKNLGIAYRTDEGRAILLKLIQKADFLIEQFRPGYLSKIGLDPERLLEINPRLIIVEVNGYGQNNLHSRKAGHDLNYLAVSGVLHQMQTRDGQLQQPGIQIADIAGGSYGLLIAALSAMIERNKTGKGGFYHLSMSDALLPLSVIRSGLLQGVAEKPQNYDTELGGALPNYRPYATADGKFMAVGSLEPKFAIPMLQLLGIEADLQAMYTNSEYGSALQQQIEACFKTKTREEWIAVFKDVDCCVTPVLDISECESYGYVGNYTASVQTADSVSLKSFVQPFYSGPSGSEEHFVAELGEDTSGILKDLGYTELEIQTMIRRKVVLGN